MPARLIEGSGLTTTASEVKELNREQSLRHRADELGYILRRSRRRGSNRNGRTWGEYQRDRGGWMIVDAATDKPITGLHHERTLDEIEAFLDLRG